MTWTSWSRRCFSYNAGPTPTPRCLDASAVLPPLLCMMANTCLLSRCPAAGCQVDENENGDLVRDNAACSMPCSVVTVALFGQDLNEFLTVYSMIVANSEVAAGSDGIQLNARRRISRLSFYVRTEMMRFARVAAAFCSHCCWWKHVALTYIVLDLQGVGALMRWVHQDGGKVGGDITGPSIPTHRRFPRQLVLRRDVRHSRATPAR